MMLVPSGNLDVVYLAEPDVSFFVTRTAVPFRYLILPVGMSPEDDETEVVNITGFSDTDGLTEERSVVVVVVVEGILDTKAFQAPSPLIVWNAPVVC